MDILPTSHDVNYEIKLGGVTPTVEIAKGLENLKKDRIEVKLALDNEIITLKYY